MNPVEMFHTILTLSYLIPNIYLFIRIRQLFISAKSRFLYNLIYLSLFSVYPLANLPFTENFALLTKAGYYIMPFFLYLFLLLILTDLMLFFNKLFKLFPPENLNGKELRRNYFLSMLFISLVIVTGGIINFNTIRVSEFNIEIAGKDSDEDHMKIAFVSDFHLHNNTPGRFAERFAEKIKMLNPDIMLFGGDILEGDGGESGPVSYERLLGNLRPKFGSYGVPGNHEHYGERLNDGFFRRSGITMLHDSVAVINSTIIIAGRNDIQAPGRKSIDELLDSVSDTLPVIVLDHRPNDIENVSRTIADIQLSGHTHNGQLFPLNLITRKIYKLSWGYLKTGNTNFFVSSGIRLWGPPVRTTGKSEIIVVNVGFNHGS